MQAVEDGRVAWLGALDAAERRAVLKQEVNRSRVTRVHGGAHSNSFIGAAVQAASSLPGGKAQRPLLSPTAPARLCARPRALVPSLPVPPRCRARGTSA